MNDELAPEHDGPEPLVDGGAAENGGRATAADKVEEEEEEAGYDGHLPDFSDEESGTSKAGSSSSKPRVVKPVAGSKKRLPLPALNKLKKASNKSTADATVSSSSSSTAPAKQAQKDQKGVSVMTDGQLERMMAQLTMDQSTATHADGLQKEDLQRLMQSIGLNRDYLQGKRGLMGKGTKDMASVHLHPLLSR